MCDSTTAATAATAASHSSTSIAMMAASLMMQHPNTTNSERSDKKAVLPVVEQPALLSSVQTPCLPVDLHLLSNQQSINDFLEKKYKEHVLVQKQQEPIPQTPAIPPSSLFSKKTSKIVTPMMPSATGRGGPPGRSTPMTSANENVRMDHDMVTQEEQAEEEMGNLPILDFKRATSDDLLSFRSLLCFDHSSPFRVADETNKKEDDSPPMEILALPPPVTDLARAGSLSFMMPPPLLESISMSSMRVSPEPNIMDDDEPQQYYNNTNSVAILDSSSATPPVLPMPVLSSSTANQSTDDHNKFHFPPSQARFTPLPMPLDPENLIDWWSSEYNKSSEGTKAGDIPALSLLPRNKLMHEEQQQAPESLLFHKRVSFENFECVLANRPLLTMTSDEAQEENGENVAPVLIPPRGKTLNAIQKTTVAGAGSKNADHHDDAAAISTPKHKNNTKSSKSFEEEMEQEVDPDRSLLRRLHHAKFSDSQNKIWLRHYKDACEFVAKYGHCCFPYTYEPNPGLTRWAKRQRHQYRAYMAGSTKSAMTPTRLELLRDIGFVFELEGNTWQARLDRIKRFAENRNISINDINASLIEADPKNNEISSMVAWVNLQRKYHKNPKSSSPLTPERIQILEKAGIRW
eukprot:Nitzschia sp. Nitz4//scaffold266_size26515//10802//12911//NITZ4_008256-RA/size26515-augustus-gene-0.33-mRNA-1//-1//CDS//3329544865//7081//frame0